MRPVREQVETPNSIYFVSTQTAQRQPLFRHDRWARLLTETILHYCGSGYDLHAYVIMPDHIHLLITPVETLEKAVQLFKGGFSFLAKKELGWKLEIWQPGFTDHRIRDDADWKRHIEYIRRNPVEAGLVSEGQPYPYIAFPSPDSPQGLKPRSLRIASNVRAKARTLPPEAGTIPSEARTLQSEGRTLPFDLEVHI